MSFIPPKDSEHPIIITPQLYDDKMIKLVLEKILKNPKLDTLVAVAPFISPYFSRFLTTTSVKNLVLLINREKLNPEYVNDAIAKLKNVNFEVQIRERPEKSRFIHMKVMIPYVKLERKVMQYGTPKMIVSLVPICAITGSVNFTKNGITRSDELLIILKDMYSITAVEQTYDKLIENTLVKYDSAQRGAFSRN